MSIYDHFARIGMVVLLNLNLTGLSQASDKAQAFKRELSIRKQTKLLEEHIFNQKSSYVAKKGLLEYERLKIPYTFYESQRAYRNDVSLPHPLLVLFPGINGGSLFEQHIVRYFTKRGIHIVSNHYQSDNDAYAHLIGKSVANNIYAGVSIIDHFSKRSSVDPEKIALLGYSYGAIRASFLAPVEDRIKSYTLIVGSASFAETLADSKLNVIKKLKKEHKKQQGLLSDKDYIDYVNAQLPFNPLEEFKLNPPNPMLLVVSHRDHYVPSQHQKTLQKALKHPSITYKVLGHIPSIAWFFAKDLKKSLAFFEANW